MVVTDSDVKPIYNKQKPRKINLFSKASWEEIYKAYDILSNEIIQMVHDKLKVESIWEKFKEEFSRQWTVTYHQKFSRRKIRFPGLIESLKI